jgi:hypothetical protein
VSGLFIAIPGVIEGFAGKMPATSFFLALSPGIAAPLLVALYQRQNYLARGSGQADFLANLAGLVFFGGAAFAQDMVLVHLSKPVVNHVKHSPAIAGLLGAGAVFALGSVLFGISMLRAGVHPRLPAWSYTVVLPLFAASAPLPESPLKSVLHTLAGATLIWLGASVWSTSSPSHQQQPAPGGLPRPAHATGA